MPAMVITGSDGDEEKLNEAGAFGYTPKPFIFDEVEEMVGRVRCPPASDDYGQRSQQEVSRGSQVSC